MMDNIQAFNTKVAALRSEYERVPSLKFSEPYEQAFNTHRRTAFIEMDRSLLLIGAIVYLCFVFNDIAILPEAQMPYVVAARIVLSLFIFAGYYFLHHVKHPWFERYSFTIISVLLVLIAAHVSVSAYFLPQPKHVIYMLGIVQLYIVVPALLKPHSRLCLITMLAMLTMTAGVTLFSNKPEIITDTPEVNELFAMFPWALTGFLTAMVVISAYLSYAFERMLRKNWLDNEITELKSDNLAFISTQLRKLSQEDELTQIANRRHFRHICLSELKRANRSDEPLSLLMVDIDNFKSFNDTYGHQAGDDCLKQIALCLQAQCKRTTDLAARYGGEEFVILLPNTDIDGAMFIAETTRQAIEKLHITHASSPVGHVTASFGVTSIEHVDNTAAESETEENNSESRGDDTELTDDASLNRDEALIDTLIYQADAALYQAKANGRNRCEQYDAV